MWRAEYTEVPEGGSVRQLCTAAFTHGLGTKNVGFGHGRVCPSRNEGGEQQDIREYCHKEALETLTHSGGTWCCRQACNSLSGKRFN